MAVAQLAVAAAVAEDRCSCSSSSSAGSPTAAAAAATAAAGALPPEELALWQQLYLSRQARLRKEQRAAAAGEKDANFEGRESVSAAVNEEARSAAEISRTGREEAPGSSGVGLWSLVSDVLGDKPGMKVEVKNVPEGFDGGTSGGLDGGGAEDATGGEESSHGGRTSSRITSSSSSSSSAVDAPSPAHLGSVGEGSKEDAHTERPRRGRKIGKGRSSSNSSSTCTMSNSSSSRCSSSSANRSPDGWVSTATSSDCRVSSRGSSSEHLRRGGDSSTSSRKSRQECAKMHTEGVKVGGASQASGKRLRRSWRWYWVWMQRAVAAKVVFTLLMSGLDL